jgi:hypothetical protein
MRLDGAKFGSPAPVRLLQWRLTDGSVEKGSKIRLSGARAAIAMVLDGQQRWKGAKSAPWRQRSHCNGAWRTMVLKRSKFRLPSTSAAIAMVLDGRWYWKGANFGSLAPVQPLRQCLTNGSVEKGAKFPNASRRSGSMKYRCRMVYCAFYSKPKQNETEQGRYLGEDNY